MRFFASATFVPNQYILREMKQKMRARMRAIGAELVRLARQLLGRKSSEWSRPGEYPRSKSGHYRRAIRYEVTRSGQSVRVGPTWPMGAHAAMLKYGTKRMGARLVPAEGALVAFRGTLKNYFRGILS